MPGPYSVASLYNAKEGKPVPYVSFSSEKSCVGELMDEGASKLELKAPNGTLITQKDLALYRILRVADDNQVTAEECKKVLTAEGSSVPPARPIGKKTKLTDTEAVPGDCWYLLEVVTGELEPASFPLATLLLCPTLVIQRHPSRFVLSRADFVGDSAAAGLASSSSAGGESPQLFPA